MADTEFAEKSVLDILVPEASKLNIEEALNTAAESSEADDESSLLSAIPQRGLLFFDESLPIYVVLRSPYHGEASLKGKISRLAVALEAHAISSPSSAARSNDASAVPIGNQPRDVIWSARLDTKEEPVTVVVGSDDGEENQDILLIWKMFAFLSRPKIRLQAPAVIFKVSASLSPLYLNPAEPRDPYLPSGVPLPANVLQPLSNDPAFQRVTPQLSSLRLSRAMPSERPSRPATLPLKVVSRRPFRAIPALSSRIRYHRPPTLASKAMIIATLELDVPIFAQHAIEIISVKVSLADGVVEDITHGVLQLPLRCHARDNIVSLYNLYPDSSSVNALARPNAPRTLDVMIDAIVFVSSTCRPSIEIRWRANVDFSTPVNPNYTKPDQSLQRSNRPTSLPTTTVLSNQSNGMTAAAGDLSGALDMVGDMGVVINITSRDDAYIGEPFQWGIFIINHYSKPRTFGLAMILAESNNGSKRVPSRPQSVSASGANSKSLSADAVVDDNLLHAAIKLQRCEANQLVCLNADVRVGPLDPGACATAIMEFLPLAKGLLRIEALRVTDLASNETADVRELPDIIAMERRVDTEG